MSSEINRLQIFHLMEKKKTAPSTLYSQSQAQGPIQDQTLFNKNQFESSFPLQTNQGAQGPLQHCSHVFNQNLKLQVSKESLHIEVSQEELQKLIADLLQEIQQVDSVIQRH